MNRADHPDDPSRRCRQIGIGPRRGNASYTLDITIAELQAPARGQT